jgi:hypothetical protein
MNWDAIGAVAEFVGAVAVVITLFYLALQVRQSTKQDEARGLQTAIKEYLGSFEAATGSTESADIFRRGLNDFDALSPAEQGSFHSAIHSLLTGFNNAWNLHESGLLPEDEFVAMRGLFVSILISPGGTRWWSLYKKVPPLHLTTYLDESMRDATGTMQPANESFPWLRSDLYDVGYWPKAVVHIAEK